VEDDCVAEPVDRANITISSDASQIQLKPNDVAGKYLLVMPFSPAELTALPKHSDELDTSARPTSAQVMPASRKE
jgi:hypothetical protein